MRTFPRFPRHWRRELVKQECTPNYNRYPISVKHRSYTATYLP